ncbi:MAG: hypothetical protein JEY91_15325 [Spirochaetaceae bacterium]|nr:hypothetical protein [Spirochaetaceae bacterium]
MKIKKQEDLLPMLAASTKRYKEELLQQGLEQGIEQGIHETAKKMKGLGKEQLEIEQITN